MQPFSEPQEPTPRAPGKDDTLARAPSQPDYATPRELALLAENEALRKALRLGGTRQTTRAQHTRALLDRAISSLSAIFMVLDRDLRIVYINPNAALHHGAPPDLLIGRSLFDLFPDADSNPAYLHVWDAVRTRQEAIFEVHEPSDEKWYETHIGFMGDEVTFLSVDITARKQAEASLRASRAASEELAERLRLATHAGGIGIWEADMRANTGYWDERTHQIFGTPVPADLTAPLAFNWFDFVHPADRERFTTLMAEAVVTGKPFTHTYRIITAGGTVRWVRSFASLLADDLGQPLRVIGALLDVTLEMEEDERRRHEEAALRQLNAELEQRVAERTAALTEANRQLEYSVRIKDEFMATMSYELRHPLTNILEANELLVEMAEGNISPQQQRFVDVIHDSTDHLLQLISAILDFSRVQAGTLELDLQPIHAELVYRPALRLIRTATAHKDLAVAVSCVPTRLELMADPQRLKQMLFNLLDNAVKFTPPGGEIGLEVLGDAAAGVVRFTVWDTGIGIDPADQPRLFQAFSQVESGFNRPYRGIGMGLALTQQLAALHGGGVSVESTPGRGSRFTIELPWAARFRPGA